VCRIDYSDSPTFYSEKTRKAKKIHKCGECHREILPGEKYLYCCGTWDNFTQHKICSHCRVGAEWLNQECGGYIFTEIAEELWEHAQEGYGWLPARLSKAMDRGWKKFYSNELMPIPELR